MKRILYPFIVAPFFIVIVSSFAQEEAGLLKDAAALVEEGKIEEAQNIIDEVRLSLWNKTSMSCPVYCFTEKEPQMFGVYKKRISNTFARGETMYVYAEVRNYSILREDRVYHVFFNLGYKVYDKDGNYLGGEESWENFRFLAQSPIYEMFLRLSFDFDIDPGEYFLEIMVRDGLSEKETSFKLPFKKI
ncbi:MAG: hypothetical protein ACUVTO_08095 [Candidatus Caldatribacteriaceae bacterium]